jgi:hypothetical protein
MTVDSLWEITWAWPGGSPSGKALAPLDSARQIESALMAAGYAQESITVRVALGRSAGRQSAAQDREGATTARPDLDAGDRAAMGRLARRALGYTDPPERYNKDL